MDVTVTELAKSFIGPDGDPVEALRGVGLAIDRGTFFVLVGDSGSGKTTLMRSVAGLERPDTGSIALRGRTVFSASAGVFLPPQERGVGMVFQSYAIWPHLTVYDNVALPLRRGKTRIGRDQIRKRVHDALETVGLAALASRPAPNLSGGQQQRVALARALAVSSELLLMDEPMSNLDARLREEVRTQIRNITRHYGTTVLYVTHDQTEAMALADRMALMRSGRILQQGTPQELYDRSADPDVAVFFGPMNFLDGDADGGPSIRTAVGPLIAAESAPRRGRITVGIRPERVRLGDAAPGDANVLNGHVADRVYLGGAKIYRVVVGNEEFRVDAFGDYAPGDAVRISLPPESLRLFPPRDWTSADTSGKEGL